MDNKDQHTFTLSPDRQAKVDKILKSIRRDFHIMFFIMGLTIAAYIYFMWFLYTVTH